MPDSELKIRHLLKLLDDNSPKIQQILKSTLLDNSLEIIFRKPFYVFQSKPELRQELLTLLEQIKPELVQTALKKILSGSLEDIDLQKAVLLICYWNNPDLDIPSISYQLDQMSEEIGSRMPLSGHPLTFIDHISYYLFKKYQFKGNNTDYYNPDNSFLDKVLETRLGIPITLSLLYMLVAKRLEIPIFGVPMPAHFIIKFDNGVDEIFLDPFYQGKIYTRQECLNYLSTSNNQEAAQILSGCTNFEMVIRILKNIHLVYSSYDDAPNKIKDVEQFIKIIDEHFS